MTIGQIYYNFLFQPNWSQHKETRAKVKISSPLDQPTVEVGLFEPFSAKSTGTNFKLVAVAATLKIETRLFSKGTFPYSPTTRTPTIDSIRQAVLFEID
jgi:hypothetical protein